MINNYEIGKEKRYHITNRIDSFEMEVIDTESGAQLHLMRQVGWLYWKVVTHCYDCGADGPITLPEGSLWQCEKCKFKAWREQNGDY